MVSKAGRIFPDSNKNVYPKALFSYGKNLKLMGFFLN